MKTIRWEKIRIQVVLLVLIIYAAPVFRQQEKFDIDALKKQAPKVYIDCGMCDIDYIRTLPKGNDLSKNNRKCIQGNTFGNLEAEGKMGHHQRQQLETSYDYFFSIGFSYTFGSTKSKVVNPRFGNGGTSISIQM